MAILLKTFTTNNKCYKLWNAMLKLEALLNSPAENERKIGKIFEYYNIIEGPMKLQNFPSYLHRIYIRKLSPMLN